MRRYEYTNTKNQKYQTTRYPKFPVNEFDRYIFSREGDRLDLLADEYLGSAELWWIIASANNLGKGSFNVDPGIQLRIPYNVFSLSDRLQRANSEK